MYYVKLEAQKLYESFSDEEFYQLLRESRFKENQGNGEITHTKDTVNHHVRGI